MKKKESWEYAMEVETFFREFCEWYSSDESSETESGEDETESGEDETESGEDETESGETSESGSGESSETDDGKPSETATKGGKDGEGFYGHKPTESEAEAEETEEEEEPMFSTSEISEIIKASEIGSHIAMDIVNEVIDIFNSKIRKGKIAGGEMLKGYSGKINPKLCGRDDYRWLNRRIDSGKSLSKEKIKFNLFVDCSGSFWRSESTVQSIYRALEEIRKTYNRFDFSFVSINTMAKEVTKAEEFITGGGNKIPFELEEIMAKFTDRTANNMNFVLFDGDMISDTYGSFRTEELSRCRKLWDNKRTIIISDSSNKGYFDRYCPNTLKTVYCRNYTDELISELKKGIRMFF